MQISTTCGYSGPLLLCHRNRDVKSVVDEINKALDKELVLPAGYYITYGGQFENLRPDKVNHSRSDCFTFNFCSALSNV